ncbi:hypothetical protein D1007_14893 [Hordeum vulgare]|nr:hypothetical protein D1007_14893 [Hordeum vulgare]
MSRAPDAVLQEIQAMLKLRHRLTPGMDGPMPPANRPKHHCEPTSYNSRDKLEPGLQLHVLAASSPLHLPGNRPWPWCLHQEELVGWADRPLLGRIWTPVLVPKEPHDIPYLWLRLSASPQCCCVDDLTTEMLFRQFQFRQVRFPPSAIQICSGSTFSVDFVYVA